MVEVILNSKSKGENGMSNKIYIDDKTLIMFYQDQITWRKKSNISKQWLAGLQEIFKNTVEYYDIQELTVQYISVMICDALAENE